MNPNLAPRRHRSTLHGPAFWASLMVLAFAAVVAAAPLTPEQLKRIEGDYTITVYPQPFGFLVKDGVLHLKVGGLGAAGAAAPLIQQEEGKFVLSPGHPNAFQFLFDGETVRFRFWSAGQVFDGTRVGAPATGSAPKAPPPSRQRTRSDLVQALPELEARSMGPAASAGERLALASLLFEMGDFGRAHEVVAPLAAAENAADAAVELAAKLDFLHGRFDDAERAFDRLYRLRSADPARAVHALVGKLFVDYQRDRFQAIAALPFPVGVKLPLLTVARAFGGDPYRLEWRGERRETVVPLVAVDPLPVLSVTVDGTAMYVIFDTGADQLILDDAVARALGVREIDSATGSFAGGLTAKVGFGRVGSLRLGDVTLHDVPVQTLPAERFTFDPKFKVGGIVGVGLLRHFLATVDYEGARLILRERSAAASAALAAAEKGAVEVPFVLDATHLMFARGRLNELDGLTLFVDSGLASEAALVLPEQTLAVLGIPLPETRMTKADVGGGKGAFAEGFFALRSAALGRLEQRDLRGEYGALTPESYWARGFIQDGLISHRFLRRSRSWTLDFDARVMRFVPAI